MARSNGAFSRHAQDLLLDRAGRKCEMCGGGLTAYQIHHRRPRGMGGSRMHDTANPANGLVLHPHCHEMIERGRTTAYENGWLIRGTKAPQEVPVRLWRGWVLLTDDGRMLPYSPEG